MVQGRASARSLEAHPSAFQQLVVGAFVFKHLAAEILNFASAPDPSRSSADMAGARSRRGDCPARGSDRLVPRALCHVNGK